MQIPSWMHVVAGPNERRSTSRWQLELFVVQTRKQLRYNPEKCLVIVWGAWTPRPYFFGSFFNLRTDHNSLRGFLNLSSASEKLADGV